MFETRRQRLYALGAGAVAGVALMGGAAFAQTPGGSTPPPAAPSATATAPSGTAAPGGQAQPGQTQPDHQDGNCPHMDQGGGTSNSSASGYMRGHGPQA